MNLEPGLSRKFHLLIDRLIPAFLRRGLLLVLLVSCTRVQPQIQIPFDVYFGSRPLSCGTAAGDFALSDLRFFIHELAAGDDILQLVADGFWQTGTVAMLDLEDGTGACLNGTTRTRRYVTATAPLVSGNGLAFTLGVPAELNHNNPLQAEAPLSFTDMHWHWLSGYKFLRAGVASGDDGIWLHLGSTRCSGTIGNIEGCKSPNRPRVSLPDYVHGQHKVVLDLAILFDGTNLRDGWPEDCSSGPAEAACAAPFAQLGLVFDSGESKQSAKAFRLQDLM